MLNLWLHLSSSNWDKNNIPKILEKDEGEGRKYPTNVLTQTFSIFLVLSWFRIKLNLILLYSLLFITISFCLRQYDYISYSYLNIHFLNLFSFGCSTYLPWKHTNSTFMLHHKLNYSVTNLYCVITLHCNNFYSLIYMDKCS